MVLDTIWANVENISISGRHICKLYSSLLDCSGVCNWTAKVHKLEICDLAKTDPLMWLNVNKSVLNLIWILFGYKILEIPCVKWRGMSFRSTWDVSCHCWFCIHIMFWFHYLLTWTLTLCRCTVTTCFISTAIQEVLEPRVVFNQKDVEQRHAGQTEVAACQLTGSPHLFVLT